MKIRAGVVLGMAMGIAGVAASCGVVFTTTGGVGGAGSGGGMSGTTSPSGGGGGGSPVATSGSVGSSTASVTGSTGTGPEPCKPGGDCGIGMYCETGDTCMTGTCVKKPHESKVDDWVCGCDKVSYWNGSIANRLGMTVKHSGKCVLAEALPCSSGNPCSAGEFCAYPLGSSGECGNPVLGQCWGLPADCTWTKAMAKACFDAGCSRVCDIIKHQVPQQSAWYYDCP